MDDPVTDVVIVSDVDNCPKGYTVITECPCGHDAQLWEKVHGGADKTRYLCFTKGKVYSEDDDKTKDMVVESLYIPGAGSSYLMPGFKILSRTIEGSRDPIRHRQLAVKKVPRAEATKVIADIVIAKGKDQISKMYKRLEKINGVRICYRQVNYNPKRETRRETIAVDDLALQTKDLSMTDQNSGRARAASEFSAIKQHTRSSQSRSKHHGDSFHPVEEGVAVKFTEPLASAAPPESILQPPSTESTFTTPPPKSTLPDITSPPPQPSVSTQQDLQTASNVAKVSNDGLVTNQPLYPGPSPVPLPQTQPPQSNRPDPSRDAPTRTYPPLTTGPPANTAPVYPGSTTSGYPSQGGYGYGYQTQGYPPPPSGGYQHYTSQPPPQQGGYPNQAAYPPQSQYPVPSTVGYDTKIGFSFGGGTPGGQGSYPPSQPGYHQYPPSGQSTYGPSGPAKPAPYDPYRQPSPATTQYPPRENPSHSSYGFNF